MRRILLAVFLIATCGLACHAAAASPPEAVRASVRSEPTATYDGRAADAAWRQAARARIERHRKADLVVAVTGADGKPVSGAEVTVAMQRHAFGFGSAVAADRILADGRDGDEYRKVIRECFSKVVFENDLKWPSWEHKERCARTLKALDWLQAQSVAVRGHCLVWPSWKHMPRDLGRLKDDPPALRRRIATHVREEVSVLKGRIADWDVINEPLWNHDAMDVLGKGVMVEWYKIARQADPAAVLYLNDQNILASGGTDRRHQEHYEGTVRFLRKEGAPLGGLGMQCHFGENLTPPARLIKLLDRFAEFGLPIQVTEFDIHTKDRRLQADYLRDFMTAIFSHPRVEAILMWGFWAGRHWRPEAALYDRDWTLRPHGEAWRDLVLKEWWTRASGRADARGRLEMRGFFGTYEITVAAGDKTRAVTATLAKDGQTVTVRLD